MVVRRGEVKFLLYGLTTSPVPERVPWVGPSPSSPEEYRQGPRKSFVSHTSSTVLSLNYFSSPLGIYYPVEGCAFGIPPRLQIKTPRSKFVLGRFKLINDLIVLRPSALLPSVFL